jgi:hypothetical protein
MGSYEREFLHISLGATNVTVALNLHTNRRCLQNMYAPKHQLDSNLLLFYCRLQWPWPLTYWSQNQEGSSTCDNKPPHQIWGLYAKSLSGYWSDKVGYVKTVRQTDKCKSIYPSFFKGGHNKYQWLTNSVFYWMTLKHRKYRNLLNLSYLFYVCQAVVWCLFSAVAPACWI